MLILLLSGCSTSTLRVQSNPQDAEVQLVRRDGSIEKIGKTPVEIDARTQRGLFTDPVEVRVVKEGYSPQSAVVPRLSSLGGSGQINFNLNETELPKACTAREGAMSELAHGVAEASNLMQKKKLVEAGNLLQSLLVKFNSVAVLHDLMANVYYLQHDTARALESYRRSNALEPGNSQTQRMIERLQQMQTTAVGG
jgi:hypothetical protein